MKLPSVRFVRTFDVVNLRMVNVWMRVTTQEQLDNWPRATELTVTAPTFEEAMLEISKLFAKWQLSSELEAVEKAYASIADAQPSTYEAVV